jgi:c-di-GMP-related signal transduction protein
MSSALGTPSEKRDSAPGSVGAAAAAGAAGAGMSLFMARQPIFGADGKVAGYELLYRRNGTVRQAGPGDKSRMSSEVIVQSFLELGLERLTGGSRAFVNFGREMMLSRAWELLDPDAVVIELLENVFPDEEIVLACEDLRQAGYLLALDDFVVGGFQEPLLPLASIVKLDVLDQTPEAVAAMAHRLRAYDAQLLAERVETARIYTAAKEAGFSLFQGHFFSRPETIAHSGRTVEVLRLIPLLNMLLDDSVSDGEVAAIFQADPSLSYKLLRIVSSASYFQRGVQSIQHAIQMIGRQALHRWLTLLLASSLAKGNSFANEVVQTSLARAHLLEMLARENRTDAGSMALLGMFSNMDTLLQLTMSELLERVSLAPEIRRSLLRHPGAPYLRWLQIVEAYELGSWEQVSAYAAELGLPGDAIARLYPDAVQWASSTLRSQDAD